MGVWIATALVGFHLPGLALLAFMLRHLADSDPADPSDDGGGGVPWAGPPAPWRPREWASRRPARVRSGPARRPGLPRARIRGRARRG